MNIYSPVDGEVKLLENVKDEAFSQKMMGDGIAVIPYTGKIVSPVAGTISMVFPTNHALGIISDDGVEVLIHIGIDTVELNGKGFTSHVSPNQRINVGDALVDVDLNIVECDYVSDVMIIVTNTNNFKEIKKTDLAEVKSGESILIIE